MEFVAILLFALLVYHVIFTIIKFKNPEVVEIEGLFYIRRWSPMIGWEYRDNYKDFNYWWYGFKFGESRCLFYTEQDAVTFLKALKEAKKKPKVRKVDLKKYL